MYNEQARGDDQYNILTVVINKYDYTLDEALSWVADYHKLGRAFSMEPGDCRRWDRKSTRSCNNSFKLSRCGHDLTIGGNYRAKIFWQ